MLCATRVRSLISSLIQLRPETFAAHHLAQLARVTDALEPLRTCLVPGSARMAGPPVTTEWLPLRWELFQAETSGRTTCMAFMILQMYRRSIPDTPDTEDPLLIEDALRSNFLYESVFSHSSATLEVTESDVKGEIASGGRSMHLPFHTGKQPLHELRRLVYTARWQREDPVIQLPPGSTHEMTHSVTTGLSVEHSQILAKSLGLAVGGDPAGFQAKLDSQLHEEFGFRLNITAQEERSAKLTLTNQGSDCYRLFALWHVDHRITVHALDTPVRGGLSEGLQPTWAPRGDIQFVAAKEPFITFLDIRHS